MVFLYCSLVLFGLYKLGLSNELCSVFQPFKVTPENAKFQIGGPFPLHTDDCLHVRPDVVQELIAVQWALTHWNRKPQNANFKLGMSALDTCSREAESLSQTVTLLSEAGFFTPKDCYGSNKKRSRPPLGLIMPSMSSKKINSLKDILAGTQLPIITYSSMTAQLLYDAQLPNVFSTVPRLDHYIKVTTKMLHQMNINRISLIYDTTRIPKPTLDKQLAQLMKSDIIVTELLPLNEVSSWMANTNTSNIVVIMASKDELLNFISSTKLSILSLRKLYITIPMNDEIWTRSEIEEILFYKQSPSRFLILQPRTNFIHDQFRAYFLDILFNNYQSYPLLATYIQQLYNCTLIGRTDLKDCNQIDPIDLLEGYTYNRAIEGAVLATFTLGALAKRMVDDPDESCLRPGPICGHAATTYLKDHMTYTFDETDLPGYNNFDLRFGEDRTLEALKIEGIYVHKDPQFHTNIILNYTLSGEWAFDEESIKWADGNRIVSWCQPWLQECQKQACPPSQRYEQERMWLQKAGHLYLMGLFDMRQYNASSGRCNNTINDARSVAMPAAFAYVLETMRRKYHHFNLLPEVELGGIVIDSCHDPVSAVESIVATVTGKCLSMEENSSKNISIPSFNIAAFASGQKSMEFDTIRFLFNDKAGIQKPLITSNGHPKLSETADLNFAPDFQVQAKALLDFLIRQNWDFISVLLSEDDYECLKAFEIFQRLIDSDDRICISDIIRIRSDQKLESIKTSRTPSTRVVLSFTTVRDTVSFLKSQISYGKLNSNDRPVYIFIGDSQDWDLGDMKLNDDLISKFHMITLGSISLQPRRRIDEDFRAFLASINPKRLPESWFIRFWEDHFQCDIKMANRHKRTCTGEERLQIDRFGNMKREAYFMLGLETLIFALDGLYKQSCPEQKGLCRAFFEKGYQSKLKGLISRMPRMDRQFSIYNYRPKDGQKGAKYVEIGNWSESEGLKFIDTILWYDSHGEPNASIPISTCRPPLCRCKLDNDFFKRPIDTAITDDTDVNAFPDDHLSHRLSPRLTKSSIPKVSKGSFDYSTFTIRKNQWKTRSWSYIFLILNTLLLSSAVFILGLICVKLCYKVVKGNQSLGICLLCGIILLYISVYFFIFDACEFTCRMRYITHSLAYSISFGAMIAKAAQLRNSETLGFNGYVSYWNYWLLLFFIITVQLGLNTQWAIIRDPISISFLVEGEASLSSIIVDCNWTNEEFLASQIYVVILLSMALFLSLMNRNVKRNFKETRWLMYTSLICSLIWILWMTAYVMMPASFKEIIMIMESIICATVILCFMFAPKLYILFSYEPILVEYPPGFKLQLGNGSSNSTLAKPDDLNFPPTNECDLHFEDGDDLDGQQSVISANSGSTKSTSLSHSSSSASSMTTRSNDSSKPVYHTIIRKKSRNKRTKIDESENQSTIGEISPEVAQKREEVLGETTSSAH